MNTEINLDGLTGNGRVHNLTGKDRGLSGRTLFKMDELDASDTMVNVIIPEHLDNMSTSYFLGMFSKSIKSLGVEKFRAKYLFNSTKPVIIKQIEHGIKLSITLG